MACCPGSVAAYHEALSRLRHGFEFRPGRSSFTSHLFGIPYRYHPYPSYRSSEVVQGIVEHHGVLVDLLVEEELDVAGGTTTVLGENEVGDVLAFGFWIVIILAIQEHNNISILLDRTRLAKIG